MVITADLPRPDAGDAGDGGGFSVCRPPAGTLWRSESGDERHVADRRKLRRDGVYPDAFWLVLRLAYRRHGMRLSLYDALFAALVNLYGQQARRTISRVTLAGGLASAVFWPLGDALLQVMSWQEALRVYALFGLLSAMLIRTLPRQRLTVTTKVTAPPLRNERRNAWLYAAFIALITFVSNGTSTHLPEFIAHFGLPVAIGMLWGSARRARSLEVAGARLTLQTDAFYRARHAALLSSGDEQRPVCWCAAGFVLGYGAINGLVTIVKATLPLELFSAESYARRTGMLLIPGQLMAASPFAYAWLNKTLGIAGAMWVQRG
jgi:hypothetical protein